MSLSAKALGLSDHDGGVGNSRGVAQEALNLVATAAAQALHPRIPDRLKQQLHLDAVRCPPGPRQRNIQQHPIHASVEVGVVAGAGLGRAMPARPAGR